MMRVSEFRDTLDELRSTNSRTEKKEIIRDVQDSTAAISFLSGSEYDDIGLGKKTVLSVAQDVYGDAVDGTPTVSESLEQFDSTPLSLNFADALDTLRQDMQELAALSGNEQHQYLERMLDKYHVPSVVSFACLNDLNTGISDKTIANALDLRDSLPFYPSVVDAAEAPNPVENPVIHNAFDPMLAKSESNLPDDLDQYVAQSKLDGYRLIIHISSYKQGSADSQSVTAHTRRRNVVTESLPELQEIDWPHGEWIIDCEVVSKTQSYADVSERIGRTAENVKRDTEMEFGVFDVIELDGEPVYEEPFSKRYGYTKTFADLTGDKRVVALPIYTDEAEAKTVAADFEGLIWKKLDASYEFGKRSTAWVKEKNKAETVDCRAVEFVEGEGRLDGTLGKIYLETADGHRIGATGSGLTDEQRDKVWENKEQFRGATLEVEAEALGSNKSLRFPIFQRWRSDDGQPDSLSRVENVMPET